MEWFDAWLDGKPKMNTNPPYIGKGTNFEINAHVEWAQTTIRYTCS